MKFDNKKLSGAVAKARRSLNTKIKYKLGHGGNNPTDILPTRTGYCDCSGATSHWYDLRRKPKQTRQWWFETTNIHNNAKGKLGKVKVFTEVKIPVPGCLVVYPDRAGKQGHMAILTEVTTDEKGRVINIEGIDCSSGQSRKTGRAINERNLNFFLKNKNTIFVTLTEWIK